MTKVKDIPGANDAIDAVASAINESYLARDAEAFIEAGIGPDELPEGRRYRWPQPSVRPDDGLSYKEALKYVLRNYDYYESESECESGDE